jgi:glycosyltransferase involved in cell wall biosynthesis
MTGCTLLQIHWGFIVGGGGGYVQSLAQLSKEQGIHSHLLCISDPCWPTDEEGLRRIEHTRIPISGRLDLSWIQAVAEQVRLRNPDLIMTHGFNAHFVALMAQRRLNKRLPVVCSYHGPYHAVNLQKRVLGCAYERFTEYFFRRHALAVVTVADHARSRLIKRGVPAKKITVIHNAIDDTMPLPTRDNARAIWRQRWGVREDEVLIGAVGRLDPVKGHMRLIEAFTKMAGRSSAARLVLIGDGPDRGKLEARVRQSPAADRIFLAGRIAQAEQALPAFDIYVLPSLSECHSIALLEAMRAGLPIAATAVGGNPESIVHERDGLLVAAADTAALASALERLTGSSELSKRLGSNARKRYVRDFSQDVMLRKTARWLYSCAGKTKSEVTPSCSLP